MKVRALRQLDGSKNLCCLSCIVQVCKSSTGKNLCLYCDVWMPIVHVTMFIVMMLRYTRSTGSPYSDEFMRQYYQAQARARQRWPEEEFYDGVKWSKEQQRMHEEQIDEMLRNEKERRQAYEKIFQEYNKNEKERRQAYEKVFREYYKNASREHMQGNPFGDGRARFYYDYHYPNQYSLPARMIIFLWAFLFFMMMVSNPSRW